MNGGDLRFLRRALDLTQGDVADQLGCSITWVAMIERNRATPTRAQLEKLDAILGYPISREWTGRRKKDARRKAK